MGKHTPGPWKRGRHPHNIVATVEGYDEVVATIGDMPCVGGHDDMAAERGMEMEMANFRLIAAAPDLLTAAIEAKAAMDSIWRTDGVDDELIYDEMGSELSAGYFSLRAAIVKATA